MYNRNNPSACYNDGSHSENVCKKWKEQAQFIKKENKSVFSLLFTHKCLYLHDLYRII